MVGGIRHIEVVKHPLHLVPFASYINYGVVVELRVEV